MDYIISDLEPFGVLITSKYQDLNPRVLDFRILRNLFDDNHLIVLRGFSSFEDADDFASYCEIWGDISLWPFGRVLELIEHPQPQDHIFDNSYVPLHWDGMYRPQVPEFQIFNCVKAPLPGQGGRTTFSNTVSALENASHKLKELWCRVIGIYQRKMEFYNSRTISPIIVKHPYKNFSVIRYNEPHSEKIDDFVNAPNINFLGITKASKFCQGLDQELYSAQNFYAHEWKDGDVVIADNFSLLHGREEFDSRSSRHIQRVHVLSNPPCDNLYLESYR